MKSCGAHHIRAGAIQMSRTDPTQPNGKPPEWLPLEAAAKHANTSSATIKRLIQKGLVEKRLVPMPGKRPQAQVSVTDLERVLTQSVHVPAVMSQTDRINPLTEVSRFEPIMSAALERIAEALILRPEVELRDKLTWTLAEARTMTGLSRPALRELVEAHPELAIRRGRRYWFRARRLREELGG